MTQQWMLFASEFSVIAYALVAGVFLTFSDFVMRSLAATQPEGGIEAMQQINRKVFRTLFMILLLGMAAASPLMAVAAFWQGSGPATVWIVAAAVTYVVGTFGVTVVFNVPMNERLDRMAHDSAAAAGYWRRYVPVWSFWNSVRTLASAASAIFMLMAVVALA
ncbi:DUF1772 domain-containing protein [Hyphomonas sp.]|uniref:anthrone oxygenase family protein n=1 Tax=Hyphomonas sp. TaxID=87 RepID=UPI003527DF02